MLSSVSGVTESAESTKVARLLCPTTAVPRPNAIAPSFLEFHASETAWAIPSNNISIYSSGVITPSGTSAYCPIVVFGAECVWVALRMTMFGSISGVNFRIAAWQRFKKVLCSYLLSRKVGLSAETKITESSKLGPFERARAVTVTGSWIPFDIRIWNCPARLTGPSGVTFT